MDNVGAEAEVVVTMEAGAGWEDRGATCRVGTRCACLPHPSLTLLAHPCLYLLLFAFCLLHWCLVDVCEREVVEGGQEGGRKAGRSAVGLQDTLSPTPTPLSIPSTLPLSPPHPPLATHY